MKSGQKSLFLRLIVGKGAGPDMNPQPVLGIRIRRIHVFLVLLDLDPIVRGTDPDPSLFS
jgi:hypothetical protein